MKLAQHIEKQKNDKVEYLERKLGVKPDIRFDSIPEVAGERKYVAGDS